MYLGYFWFLFLSYVQQVSCHNSYYIRTNATPGLQIDIIKPVLSI